MSAEPRATTPASPRFLGALAGAAVLLLLGTMPILAGLGVVRSGDAIEPWARVVAILFGLVFFLPGAAIVVLPVRYLAGTLGARSWTEVLRLGASRLRGRVNASSIGGAATIGILAIASWMALEGRSLFWTGSRDSLSQIVTVEFLVIHGFPFFVIVGSFVRHTRRAARFVAIVWLAILIGPYAFLAWKLGGGLEGLAALAYLLVPNVLAVVRPRARLAPRVTAVSRWVVKFAVFVLVAATIGDGSVQGPGSIAVGAVYFTLLTLIELFRVPELPLDLAVAWNALPGTDGARVRAIVSTWRGRVA
jgi:hypothetical protein